MSSHSFGRYIRRTDPGLWHEVRLSQLSKAAVFGWPASMLSGVEFRGYRHTPCHCPGSGDGHHLDVYRPGGKPSQLTTAAFRGVPREHVQIGYWCRTTIWWVCPARGDAPRLGALLTRARARWLDEPPPMPGPLSFNQAYGTLLIEEAAELGELEVIQRAITDYGLDWHASAYLGALLIAANWGHIPFIQALVKAVPDLVDCAYDACEPEAHDDYAHAASHSERSATFTMMMARVPLPSCYRPVVARWVCELGDKAAPQLRDEVLKLFLTGLPIPAGCRPVVVTWAAQDPRFDAVLL